MKLRNLLIPTDFSDQSSSSLAYTLALAKDLKASVYVLHSYYVPINTIETAYVADQALWLEQNRQRAMEEMRLLEKRILQNSGVDYKCIVHPGPVMGDINKTIQEHEIDLVIIGTYESEGLASFYGELYTQAIRHAKAPVLLLPENTSYTYPEKVVFATDLRPVENQEPIKNIKSILANLGVKPSLLHVYKEGLKPKKQQELEKIKAEFEPLQPAVVMIKAEDPESGILSYVEEQGTHWLVALSHHYGLLEELFHSRHTKKLARKTKIPLLVSHE